MRLTIAWGAPSAGVAKRMRMAWCLRAAGVRGNTKGSSNALSELVRSDPGGCCSGQLFAVVVMGGAAHSQLMPRAGALASRQAKRQQCAVHRWILGQHGIRLLLARTQPHLSPIHLRLRHRAGPRRSGLRPLGWTYWSNGRCYSPLRRAKRN
eukprot:scaffold920_cov135-Isochrysis_galbana.AAC.5